MTNTYMRQEDLALKIPHKMGVVGIGGVGSWVALFGALAGIRELIILDDDVVEEHNRNRTPFKAVHVGRKKVEGLKELILEMRPETTVTAIPERWETVSEETWFIDEMMATSIVIDCRDAVTPLTMRGVVVHTQITGGYDGLRGTIHVKPDYTSIFGAEETVYYRVTPSYVVPPVMIAIMIINYLIVEQYKKNRLDMTNLVIPFDATKILSSMFRSKM